MRLRTRHIARATLAVTLTAAAATALLGLASSDGQAQGQVPGPGQAQAPQRGATTAAGATPTAAESFLNPFPDNDVWRGILIGDYLAEGLLYGIADAMASDQRLQLIKQRRALNTIGQRDIEEEAKALEEMAGKEKLHVAVIMLGMADRGGVRLPNGRRLAVGQGEWRQQFGAKVERIARGLRRRGVAVYWVGLPIMRRSDWNEDIEQINDVIRERTLNSGGRYIDAFKESADVDGRFAERGPDITGKVVRLRDPEGYELTPAAYRKLAIVLERQMKRDMNTAREERVIPLAGSEVEQKRINPDRQAAIQAEAAAKGQKDARAAASPVTRALASNAGTAAAEPQGAPDLKAENVRVSFKTIAAGGKEEQVTLEIVRPALTQSVVQLMTRRDKGDKASQVGDTLTDTLSNGLLVMRSVTPSRPGGGSDRGIGGSSRAALTQQPFFIALAKGERLPPKPGRADDFRWPREDDVPPPPVAAAAPIASPVPLAQPASANTRQQRVQRQRLQRQAPPRDQPAPQKNPF